MRERGSAGGWRTVAVSGCWLALTCSEQEGVRCGVCARGK